MVSAAELTKPTSDFGDWMSRVVDGWRMHVRQTELPAKSSHEGLRHLVLPPPAETKSLANVQRITETISSGLQVKDDEALAGLVKARIDRIVVDLAGNIDTVMLGLSDLAFECAMNRTLILPSDRFHVSPSGVLAAASFANAQVVTELIRNNKGQPVKKDVLRRLVHPFTLALAGGVDFAPGDFWLFDIFARSLRQTAHEYHRLSKANPETGSGAAQILLEIVPRFTSISLIYKLIQANDLGSTLAKKSRYDLWPGLDVLVASEGAGALRNLVVGDLAHQVAHDQRGLARSACVRFLAALLSSEGDRLKSRVLIATLLWEILEQNDQVLLDLIRDERYASTILAAVNGIIEFRGRGPQGSSDVDRRRLDEICLCLETYTQFNSLVSIQAPQLHLQKRIESAST